MKMPTGAIVVLDIAGRTARLYCSDKASDAELNKRGFNRCGDVLERSIADESERREVVKLLVEAKALFSAGRDWSPEDVVRLYREQGVIDHPYQVIAWKEPDTYEIRSR